MPHAKTGFLIRVAAGVLPLTISAYAATIYDQPPSPSGGLYHSSWWDPDGSDYDQYVWDGFILGSNEGITEVHWRGAYDPAYFGSGGPVIDFTVEIWSSIQGGSQPDIGSVFAPNPLVQYDVGGNAGQTPAGVFGGVTMYDYTFTLPTPFQATAGTKYWVQIEAWQHGIPDWGIAVGTAGDGHYFRRIANVGDIFFQLVPGDAGFSLRNAAPQTYTITTAASPVDGGTIAGGGEYLSGSSVSLVATPNFGYAFVDWTENSVEVSASATYNFTAGSNRTLVAHFVLVIPTLSHFGLMLMAGLLLAAGVWVVRRRGHSLFEINA